MSIQKNDLEHYRAEAARCVPHLSPEEQQIWAEHCCEHHPGHECHESSHKHGQIRDELHDIAERRERKYLWIWRCAVLATLLLLCVLEARAQDPASATIILRFQQDGTTLATRTSGLVQMDCSTGMTCTWSGNKLTITAAVTPSIPAGTIGMIITGTCAAGWTEVAALSGKTLVGTVAANMDVGTTGGSDTIVPSGTNTAPTFTGNSVSSSAVSAGTPAGTNSAPAFTGTGSQSTSGDSAGTPAGTVGSISLSGSTANEASHTHGVTAAGTNGTGTVTPLGTIAWPAGVPTNASGAFTQGAISWPAGVPTNSAITMSGSTANESTHTHTYTQVPNHVHVQSVNSAAAGGLSGYTADTSTATSVASGYSTANPTGGVATGTTAAGIAHLHAIGTVAASTPTISWPAGVPTIAAGSFTQPTISWPAGVPTLSGSSSTTSAQVFTGSPVTSGAGSSHLHAFGTLAASTPTFTGDVLGTHSHTFTATGTVAAPIFTGSALGTHQHTTTATGSVSAPVFTGDSADNRSAFTKVIFCSKD